MNSKTPFARGSAEELADHLCEQLNATEFARAEVLQIPFSWDQLEHLAEQIFLNCTLQLPNVDRVIALRFPGYLIPHPAKVVWLMHQSRQLDDLLEADESDNPAWSVQNRLREMIHHAEAETFSKCRRIFTTSKAAQKRLKHRTGFDSEVLIPPLNRPELFADSGNGGYLFAGGRININNRQHLLVESLASTKSRPKLIVAGPPDAPEDANRLQVAVTRFRLEDRVVLDFGFHDITRIADYVSHSRACADLSVDDQSLGYSTIQAVAASKPVIAATDSSATGQFVLNGETGCVTDPDPEGIAQAIDLLLSEPARSKEMGRAARSLWDSFHAKWPDTIERLLS